MMAVPSLWVRCAVCHWECASQSEGFDLMGEFQTPSLYYNRHHIYNILVPSRDTRVLLAKFEQMSKMMKMMRGGKSSKLMQMFGK